MDKGRKYRDNGKEIWIRVGKYEYGQGNFQVKLSQDNGMKLQGVPRT